MINNLFKNKLFYYSKKLFHFFLDKINDFNTENYSKFYFLTEELAGQQTKQQTIFCIFLKKIN